MISRIYSMNNYINAYMKASNFTKSKSIMENPFINTNNALKQQGLFSLYKTSLSSYLKELNKSISSIKSSSTPLLDKGINSSFNKMAVDSDSDSIFGVASNNANKASYTVNINNLAKSQKNIGMNIDSLGRNAFETGLNTISIKFGENKTKNVSFMISDNDYNKKSLEKMATAINGADFGLKANVISNSKTGQSYIEVKSEKTGTDNSFIISDINGNSTSASGINNIFQESENASYKLDDKEFTSQTNDISLNDGKIQITFQKADSKDVKLNITNDTDGIKDDIKKLMSSYNSLINLAKDSSNTIGGAERLAGEASKILESKNSLLSSIGIDINKSGLLSINDEKLDNSIKNSLAKVKNIISGTGGIAEKLYEQSNKVISNPIHYSQIANIDIPSKNLSMYNTSKSDYGLMIMKNTYSGMLFDYYL